MNNAGVAQIGSAITTNLDVVQYVMDVNVLGTISLTKAVLPHMVHKKTGQIVVISSSNGKSGELKNLAKSPASVVLDKWIHEALICWMVINISSSGFNIATYLAPVVQRPDELDEELYPFKWH